MYARTATNGISLIRSIIKNMIPIEKITGRLGNQMFQYAFLYTNARKNGIDCYYQDPKFFQEVADDIKQIFRQDIYAKTDMVAIHVRRGDYVGHHFYVDLSSTEYYRKAMELFPDKDFIVFSDDIEWCKEQEIFKDCDFSYGDEIEDMNLMASCTGHIIANSSFSWWGAFISPYTEKVVAPRDWYSDGAERTVCPSNWIKI